MSGKFLAPSVIVACAVASSSCGLVVDRIQGVRGSGRQAAESRHLTDSFTKIRDDVAANLQVKVGPELTIKISGDDNIVPLVRTRIEDGALIIDTKKRVHQNRKLEISITVPSLDEISLNGAGNVHVEGIHGDSFTTSLAGAGNIELSGHTGSLDASLDGAGNLQLTNLQSSDASVTVDGAGNADVWATKTLAASVDGVGNVRYKGDPNVTRSVNGVGRVEQIGG